MTTLGLNFIQSEVLSERKLDHVLVHMDMEAQIYCETVPCTVNSEIFARVLLSWNFAYAKFRENNILAKWRNHSGDY